MVEPNTAPKAKAKPAPEVFETPKYEIPNPATPNIDGPAIFREFAEKSVAQAKQAYDQLKTAAEESTAVLEDTFQTTVRGVTAYNLKVIEAARANTNAAFDFATQFATVKSVSEAVELSSAHARKQFEALTAQTRELTALAQKVASESTEPIKNSVSSALNKVA